jgi:catechol 2,3-dioxygenase-like lactoylglutathione lyase family enzyme
MSRITGAIRQLGIVAHDADAAMHYWTETLGVGPFFVLRSIQFAEFYYRGCPSASPTVTLCFAQSGALQIEIIQQHDAAPSAYRDFLATGREGPQHVAAWFAGRADYNKAYHRLSTQGLNVVHQGKGAGADFCFAYFSRGEGLYPQIEISEALQPAQTGFIARVSQAAQDWDGSHPVRSIDGTPDTSRILTSGGRKY